MSGHMSQERMHDLIDGLLPAAEQDRVMDHLETCRVCREDVAVLQETVEALRALPRAAAPAADLWDGIRDRIDQAPRDAVEAVTTVVPFPHAPGAERPRRRRFTFSGPQLAAAALVVALGTAAAMRALVGGGVPVTPGEVSGRELARATSPVLGPAARAASTSDAGYQRATVELEDIVARGRDVLEPETLEVLERSLATIDRALGEVGDALRADPGSELLGSMLVSHQTARLRVLRQAATAIQARS